MDVLRKWYVVQVVSTKEKKVKKALEDFKEVHGMSEQIDEVVLPTENVLEVKQGQQKVSEKRIWPGYILVKMVLNDDSWTYVTNTNGVVGFLGGEIPTPLNDDEVEDILNDLEDKKQGVTQKHKFSSGDYVKITDGVFVNFVGTIIEVYHDKGRLSALVSIFGRETQVDDLEFWQVEEYNEDKEEG